MRSHLLSDALVALAVGTAACASINVAAVEFKAVSPTIRKFAVEANHKHGPCTGATCDRHARRPAAGKQYGIVGAFSRVVTPDECSIENSLRTGPGRRWVTSQS